MEELTTIIEDLIINSGWGFSEIEEIAPEDILYNYGISVSRDELENIINSAIDKYGDFANL